MNGSYVHPDLVNLQHGIDRLNNWVRSTDAPLQFSQVREGVRLVSKYFPDTVLLVEFVHPDHLYYSVSSDSSWHRLPQSLFEIYSPFYPFAPHK